MTEEVEIGDATVVVVPMDELSSSWAMTASIVAGRVQMAQEDGDLIAMKEAFGDLLEICTEDGITSGGVQELEPESLNALISAMLPKRMLDDEEDDEGNDEE